MSKSRSFRVGRVAVYRRGSVWYLRYYENGQRRQPRVGPDRAAAEQLASEVNAQLVVGAPAATSFEPIGIETLRQAWLDYHEHTRRSSVATLARYRSATQHLIDFVRTVPSLKLASQLRAPQAEAFAKHLRSIEVAPNGHANTQKRPLRDKGVRFVLEVCRSLFGYAIKRRHLPPYSENPFAALEIDRIRIDDAKPIVLLSEEHEVALLEKADDWAFPVFLTLALTGLRPGELTHLLLPEDLDLHDGWLYVRNKADLGWRIKTRGERKIPLLPELVGVLKVAVGARERGPVFVRRRFANGTPAPLAEQTRQELAAELDRRIADRETVVGSKLTRAAASALAWSVWRDAGAIKEEMLRLEFMKLTAAIDLRHVTAPKTLRHQFATRLQEANVDPMIRNQLMGHAPASGGTEVAGLGMTGVYTHTRDETLRKQLIGALTNHGLLDAAQRWVIKVGPVQRSTGNPVIGD